MARPQTSYTFHTFPPQLRKKIPPQLQGETSGLYVRGSEPPLLFKDRPDHGQGCSAWQPLAKLTVGFLGEGSNHPFDRKERGRERGGVIYSGVLITPQRSCGFTQTWLQHRRRATSPVAKRTSESKAGSREAGWLAVSAAGPSWRRPSEVGRPRARRPVIPVAPDLSPSLSFARAARIWLPRL